MTPPLGEIARSTNKDQCPAIEMTSAASVNTDKLTKKKPPSRGTFICPDCSNQFSRREYVERHRRLKHLNSRPFQCPTCDHAFARSDLLRRHAKSCKEKTAADVSEMVGAIVGGHGMTAGATIEEDADPGLDQFRPKSLDSNTYRTHRGPYELPAGLNDNPNQDHNHYTYSSGSGTSSLPSLSPDGKLDQPSPSSASSQEGPPSPFCSADFNLFSLTAAHHAQAPILDHSGYEAARRTRTPAFTQDEILASEVLEDLLRSPQPRFVPNLPLSQVVPWHGAKAVTGSWDNEAIAVVGSDGDISSYETGASSSALARWGSDQNLMEIAGNDNYQPDSNGIENSPEALALADYFAQGGVGGITALDLGFSYEPSLYPDHLLFEEDESAGRDQFFLPGQRFCVGYLFPWHVPPLKQLSAYAARAANSFLPSIPIVHTPSMILAEMPTHSAFALTVVGAAYETGGEQFSNEMLVEKRIYLVRNFNKEGATEDEKFASLQSMLLYQLLGLFHRDEQQRLLSHTFHGALVMMMRQLSLPTRIRQTYLVQPHPHLEGEVLEASWKLWIKVETWRRVAFIVLLADLETATHFDTSPLLPFSELVIDLPSSDSLWQAKTASAWLALRLAPSTPQSIPFLDAIRALLSPTKPEPYTTDGILLAELPRLPPFPLLILSRTLSFLQKKTEEAIAQVDPFRFALGGLGLYEDREKENLKVLERIQRGREILKTLPGGVKRGGGEKWYEGVMPTSIRSPGRGEGNLDGQGMRSEEGDEDARKRAEERVAAERAQFTRNIVQAKEMAQREFPSFFGVTG